MRRFSLWLLAGVLVLAVGAALAHPPANFDPQMHQWFESLKQPGTGMGCCAESDCKVLADKEWHQTAEGFAIKFNGAWVPVPPEKVLDNQPNPTGGPVACYRTGYDANNNPILLIFCFVRMTEA
jgi:hypothetical protein